MSAQTFEIKPITNLYSTIQEWLEKCLEDYTVEFASLCAALLPAGMDFNTLILHCRDTFVKAVSEAANMLGIEFTA